MRNPEAVAWVIATEGSISLTRSHSHGRDKWYYRPVISVGSMDEELCLSFQDLTGKGHVYLGNSPYGERYAWVLQALQDCIDFLKEIIPYLPIKVEQAETLLGFCESRVSRGYNSLYTDWEYFCWEHMRELNKRRERVKEE